MRRSKIAGREVKMLSLSDQSTTSSRLDSHQNVTFSPELFIQTACVVILCSGTGLYENKQKKTKKNRATGYLLES